MDAAIHFISGLPRSGSTLLSAILRQNPRFHAGMTGPMSPMTDVLLRHMSMRNENAVFFDDAMREAVVRSVFSAFYAAHSADDVVFDTNRMWCARLPIVTALFPKARVICCVRGLPEIYDSVERLARKNMFQPSAIFDYDPAGTVYSRVEQLSSADGMIGSAWNALREGFCGEQSNVLILITYETLTKDPQKALAAIYDFIGEPAFAHDFDNVAYDGGDEFDRKLGAPGLHEVRSNVKFERREPVLPPDIIRRFAQYSFWADPGRNPNGVQVI